MNDARILAIKSSARGLASQRDEAEDRLIREYLLEIADNASDVSIIEKSYRIWSNARDTLGLNRGYSHG